MRLFVPYQKKHEPSSTALCVDIFQTHPQISCRSHETKCTVWNLDHSRNPQVHSTDPRYSSAKRWISMNFGHSGHEECHLGAKMVPILPKWFSRFHDKERTNPVIHDPKNPSLEELSQAILIEATTRRVWPNQTDWGFGRRDNVDNEVSGFSGRFFAVKNSGRVLLR